MGAMPEAMTSNAVGPCAVGGGEHKASSSASIKFVFSPFSAPESTAAALERERRKGGVSRAAMGDGGRREEEAASDSAIVARRVSRAAAAGVSESSCMTAATRAVAVFRTMPARRELGEGTEEDEEDEEEEPLLFPPAFVFPASVPASFPPVATPSVDSLPFCSLTCCSSSSCCAEVVVGKWAWVVVVVVMIYYMELM